MLIQQVAYRYSDDEFAALLALNNLSDLPGVTENFVVRDRVARGIVALEEDSLMIRTPDGSRLEIILAFIANRVASAAAWVSVRGDGRVASARFSHDACVLVEHFDGGPWLISPFPTAVSARVAFEEILESMEQSVTVITCPKGPTRSMAALDEFDRLSVGLLAF